jgi:hypothetical protein
MRRLIADLHRLAPKMSCAQRPRQRRLFEGNRPGVQGVASRGDALREQGRREISRKVALGSPDLFFPYHHDVGSMSTSAGAGRLQIVAQDREHQTKDLDRPATRLLEMVGVLAARSGILPCGSYLFGIGCSSIN